MSKDLLKHFIIVVFLFLIPACATIGPRITREEKQRAQALLRAEAQAWKNRQELRIHAVAARLIEAADNVKPLEFHFVAKPKRSGPGMSPDVVNAWTDGKGVWVTRGMVRFLKNDDELAIILAHEMAHAYKAHVQYSIARGIFGVALGAVAEAFAPRVDYALAKFHSGVLRFQYFYYSFPQFRQFLEELVGVLIWDSQLKVASRVFDDVDGVLRVEGHEFQEGLCQ